MATNEEQKQRVKDLVIGHPPYTTEDLTGLCQVQAGLLEELQGEGLLERDDYGYWYPSSRLVLERLAAFLEERFDYDDGVSEEDIGRLEGLFRSCARLKWGPDSDGDTYVEVQVIDRTRYHQPPWLVPYFHKEGGDPGFDALHTITCNLGIAQTQLDWYVRIQRSGAKKRPNRRQEPEA